MTLSVEHAAWGWAGVAIALAGIGAGVGMGWRHWKRRSARSARWYVAGIVLPLLAAAGIALALAGIVMRRQADLPVVMLLDFSGSARKSPWQDPAWVRTLAERKLGAGRRVTVVGFGGTTRVLLDDTRVGDAQAWPAVWRRTDMEALTQDDFQTDVHVALAWRLKDEAAHAAGPRAPRWVITDGLLSAPASQTVEPPYPLAWTVLPPGAVDVGVRTVAVRGAGSGGAEENGGVEVLAQVRAVGPLGKTAGGQGAVVQAAVVVRRDETQVASEKLQFKGSGDSVDAERWISVRDRPPEDGLPHRYTVAVRLLGGAVEGDPWPENDRGTVLWRAEPPGTLRVLAVGNHPPAAGLAGAAYIPVERFVADAGQLAAEGWQAIVLEDVPADMEASGQGIATAPAGGGVRPLSAAAARALKRFVEETGGGLLIMGDGHAFGPGHYGEGAVAGAAGDTLEDISPFWSHPHQGARLQVVFVLDASGSMNETAGPAGGATAAGGTERKFRVLARGVEQAAALLSADDRVVLVAFNDSARVLADGAAGAVKEALRTQLEGVEPTGPTAPDSALPAVARAIQQAGAQQMKSLVVLLTDGDIPAMNVAQWQDALGNGTAARARLCVIAPGPVGTSDARPPSALEQLTNAVSGSVWLKTTDPLAWSTLLRRAVADQVRGTLQHVPLAWHSTAPVRPAITGTADSWTQVWLKPEATLTAEGTVLETGLRAPLAATVKRGLGKVGAMVIGESGTAAGESAAAYRAMRDWMIAHVAGEAGDRRFTTGARRSADGAWIISADGRDEKGFLDGESLAVRVIGKGSADGPAKDVLPMDQSAPGHYEARVPAGIADGNEPLAAVIARVPAAGVSASGEPLVARVALPAVQTAEWPATVPRKISAADWPAGALHLDAGANDAGIWDARGTGSPVDLGPWLWMAAAVAALAALWLRG